MRKLSTATPSSVFFLPPSPHSESHLARETSVTRTADNNYPRFLAKRGRSLASLLVMSSYLLSRRYWYKWGYFGLFLSCSMKVGQITLLLWFANKSTPHERKESMYRLTRCHEKKFPDVHALAIVWSTLPLIQRPHIWVNGNGKLESFDLVPTHFWSALSPWPCSLDSCIWNRCGEQKHRKHIYLWP